MLEETFQVGWLTICTKESECVEVIADLLSRAGSKSSARKMYPMVQPARW